MSFLRPSRTGGSNHLRDHSAAFRRMREDIVREEPLCRYCMADGLVTAATVLDHIVALSLGGSNERDNLAPACVDCNDLKSTAEKRFILRGYDACDVMLDPDLGDWIRRARVIERSAA